MALAASIVGLLGLAEIGCSSSANSSTVPAVAGDSTDGGNRPLDVATTTGQENSVAASSASTKFGVGDPSRVPLDFVMRQAVHGEYRGQSIDFEAVVQKIGSEVRIIGLAPWGSRAFVLRQSGDQDIHFESFMKRELPFPPEYILRDVHQTLLWVDENQTWWRAPVGEELQGQRKDGCKVLEDWRGEFLENRSFVCASSNQNTKSTLVSIQYQYQYQHASKAFPPRIIVLENLQYGYQLQIENLSMQVLNQTPPTAELAEEQQP